MSPRSLLRSSLLTVLVLWNAPTAIAETTIETIEQKSKATSIFSVMIYNAYLKPRPFNTADARYRAKQMTTAIGRATSKLNLGKSWPDVIVIAEGFDDHLAGERSLGPKRNDGYNRCVSNDDCILKRGLWNAGYKWITENVGTEGYAIQDGGVFIASRHPILATAKIIYNDFVCSDRFADKGAIYAKIDKDGQTAHIFGTHLQATYFHPQSKTVLKSCSNSHDDDGVNFQAIRNKQLVQLTSFIQDQEIAKNAPIVVAGDMNIELNSTEFVQMLTKLNARKLIPKSRVAGKRLSTFDSFTNSMKRCVLARDMPSSYRSSCGEFGFAPDMWNDYVLLLGQKSSKTSYLNTVLEIEAAPQRDLSDHHAVIGWIELTTPPKKTNKLTTLPR